MKPAREQESSCSVGVACVWAAEVGTCTPSVTERAENACSVGGEAWRERHNTAQTLSIGRTKARAYYPVARRSCTVKCCCGGFPLR